MCPYPEIDQLKWIPTLQSPTFPTNCCDDGDAVEECSSKCPGHRGLIFLPVPSLLLQSDDQLLLKLLQTGRHLWCPVLLMQNIHASGKLFFTIFIINVCALHCTLWYPKESPSWPVSSPSFVSWSQSRWLSPAPGRWRPPWCSSRPPATGGRCVTGGRRWRTWLPWDMSDISKVDLPHWRCLLSNLLRLAWRITISSTSLQLL